MQVELAQLRYRLPRLRGRGNAAQPAGRGGIGTRGPGETQLEVDRRRILHAHRTARARPRALWRKNRDTQRKAPAPQRAARPSRSSATPTRASPRCSTASPTPTCSSRTASSPRSTPPPAACACPAARPCSSPTPSGSSSACPHQLVEAFQSTLEEVVDADLLVHVVDAELARRRRADRRRRARCCARSAPAHVPELLVLNKADLADPGDVKALLAAHPRCGRRCRRSTGEGVNVLLDTLAARLRALAPIVELLVPVRAGRRRRRAAPGGRGAGGSARRGRDVGCGRACPAMVVTRFDEFVVTQTQT